MQMQNIYRSMESKKSIYLLLDHSSYILLLRLGDDPTARMFTRVLVLFGYLPLTGSDLVIAWLTIATTLLIQTSIHIQTSSKV